MSRVLAVVEEVFKLAVLDKNDLREGYAYDVFYTYPKGSYTYLGEKTILTIDGSRRVYHSSDSFIAWKIMARIGNVTYLHLFLPKNSRELILEALRSSQFSAAAVKEAIGHLYSGQTLEIT